MIRRMWLWVVAGLCSLTPTTAHGQAREIELLPPPDVLPFARDPAEIPGPPRSMGEAPFDQRLPPSDRANPVAGPPRSMGEVPFYRPLGPTPMLVPRPAAVEDPRDFPRIAPDLLRPLPPTGDDRGLPDALLLTPGLFGREEERGLVPQPPEAILVAPAAPMVPPRVDNLPPGPVLTSNEIRFTAEQNYPPFQIILQERNYTEGDLLASWGAFDLNISADSRNYPLGFYNRAVHDVFLDQPVFRNGSRLFAGYRLAYGKYPTYYTNLLTRGGGAFVSGFEMPLVRNRRIDVQRARVFKSELERQRVEPRILRERISLMRDVSRTYWTWVTAGMVYALHQKLVEIVQLQFEAVMEQYEQGVLAAVDVVSFQTVLLGRQQQLINANRDFQVAAINLSLFYRDRFGLPTLPDPERLPMDLPPVVAPDESAVFEDISVALELRPELLSLQYHLGQARIERELAENFFLPRVNFYIYNEQNFGDRLADLLSDFRPNILEATLLMEVPLQRRYARGRMLAADATIRQVATQFQFARDQIQADVFDAHSAVRNAYDAVIAYRNVEAVTRELEAAERERFREGASTLLLLYVRGQSSYDAMIQRLRAEGRYFIVLADYRAALGLDAVLPEMEQNVFGSIPSNIDVTFLGNEGRRDPGPEPGPQPLDPRQPVNRFPPNQPPIPSPRLPGR